MSYGLVWFKRDLRWEDHAALAQAAKLGPIRCIYVIEPELWLQPDVALQHFEFIRESLHVLDAHLRAHGGGPISATSKWLIGAEKHKSSGMNLPSLALCANSRVATSGKVLGSST